MRLRWTGSEAIQPLLDKMGLKLKIAFIIFLLVFTIGLMIISNNNLHVDKAADRTILFNSFVSWIGDIRFNLDLNAFAVKKDWLPDNGVNVSVLGNES